jgi:hypothetical protein
MAVILGSRGRPLASGELAYHILDTMIATDDAIKLGQTVDVLSTIDPVPLLDEAWDPYRVTLEQPEQQTHGRADLQ